MPKTYLRKYEAKIFECEDCGNPYFECDYAIGNHIEDISYCYNCNEPYCLNCRNKDDSDSDYCSYKCENEPKNF